MKERYTQEAISRLKNYFDLRPEHLVHVEAATPRSFETFTGREQGIVGGIGQKVPTFGPFGFATRTPVKNLWLVGDSTHPGEGTAKLSSAGILFVTSVRLAVLCPRKMLFDLIRIILNVVSFCFGGNRIVSDI